MIISVNDMLYAFSYALDSVEHELVGATTYHSKRVAYISAKIGMEMGMSEFALMNLTICAVLHDNALTEYIQSEYKKGTDVIHDSAKIDFGAHCVMGEENIKKLPVYNWIQGAILYHHENADGSGAFGKKAGDTPLYAQIIHLADQLDVNWDLSYVPHLKYEQILQWITQNSGILFSDICVCAFEKAFTYDIISNMKGENVEVLLKGLVPNTETEHSGEELMGIAGVFAKIVDYKSPFTRRHSIGIAEKAMKMAYYYGENDETAEKLYFAGALHDIGKLVVDKDILEKPDKLTEQEFKHIQNHAYYTYDILRKIRGLEDITLWASLHHEKLDGSGYPFHKKAEDLNQKERLMACLDIYQALIEEHPYKSGMSHERAMEILENMAEQNLIDGKIVEDINLCFK